MTTHTTNETPSPASESASGQTFGAESKAHDTTTLTTLQHRVGCVRLVARAPGRLIALHLPDTDRVIMLSLTEAALLAAAIDSLITDLTFDTRARDWSRRACDRLGAPTSEPA